MTTRAVTSAGQVTLEARLRFPAQRDCGQPQSQGKRKREDKAQVAFRLPFFLLPFYFCLEVVVAHRPRLRMDAAFS